MKKFLFTLAALLMAGSLSASNYFYLADFEVPESALGATGTAGRINVDVKAHFTEYVSAWSVVFTLPEGLTIAGHRAGSDLTLSGYDDFGDPKTFTPNLKVSQDKLTVIVACDEADYDADGEGIMYGCMKWAPGDYDQMWIVVFNATEDFKGGEVTVTTTPACGGDIRPEITPCVSEPYTPDTPTEVTVEGATPSLTDLTADIVIGDADGLFVPITVTNVNDAAAEIVVTVGGVEYPIENGGITLPEYDTDYNVLVTVTAKGEGFQGVVTEDKDVHTGVKPADPTADKPIITFTPITNGVKIEIDNYTEYTIKVNNELVDSRALPFEVEKGWVAKHIEVYAKNAPANYTPAENTDTYDLAALENMDSEEAEAGTPSRDPNNLIVPITGNVVSVTVDGQPGVFVDGNLLLPRAEQDYTPEIVIVTNDGEHYNDATVTIDDITVPAWVTQPTIDINAGQAGGAVWHDPVQDPNTGVWTPGWTEYTVDGHYVDVTFTTVVPGATLYWQILDENGDVYLQGSTTDPSKVVTINENGTYTAVAWVVTENDESRKYTRDFEINDMTSVNELVNGKTVAGVRYFNVAGQEMPEANGMTIVVTTYTDGTTSTVKVMK